MTLAALILANLFIMFITFVFGIIVVMDYQPVGKKFTIESGDWSWVIISSLLWTIGLPVILIYAFCALFK